MERSGCSWGEAARIQTRAVARGLRRRTVTPARHLGIDETAFQRRHEYVTVVTDLDQARVLYVADTRRRESLDGFWAELPPAGLEAIEAVAIDMWEPYIGSTRAHLPQAEGKRGTHPVKFSSGSRQARHESPGGNYRRKQTPWNPWASTPRGILNFLR